MASIYKRLSSNNYSNNIMPGAATAANQVIEINLLTSIDAEIAASNVTLLSIDSHVDGVETLLTSIDSKLTSPLSVTGPLTDAQLRATPVPVTGSFSITGGATSANQTNGSQKTQLVDGSGNVISSTSNALNVSVANFPSSQNVVVTSSALPTGASTSALQTTGNASLASIDSKLTAPLSVNANITNSSLAVTGPLTDTQLRATAVPVSISGTVPVSGTVTANIGTTGGLALDTSVNSLLKPASTLAAVTTVGSVTSITNPVAVTGTFFQATQPVSIAATVAVSGPLTDTQLRATPVPVNGTVAVTGPLAVTQSGTWNVGLNAGANAIGSITNTSFIATQTTGTNLHTVVDSGTVSISGSVAVTGPLTDTQLRATPVPVSLTSTTVTNTVAVSGTVTANAGTNLNTSALNLETTQSAINTKLPSGLTVTSTRLLVDGSGVTQPISAASLPLPTGASTSALQTTGNTSLSTIATNTTNLTVAQGSTTSGQTGQLVQGAVTTAAPTYTTGQTSPLSLTTGGALRVSGTFAPSVLPNTVVTGTIAALNAFVQISCDGYSTVSIDVLGTFVGSWIVYGTNDGSNVFPLTVNAGGAQSPASGYTVPRAGVIVGCGGYSSVIVYCTAYTSGTMNVRLQASVGAPPAVRVYTDAVSPLTVGAVTLPLPTNASTSALQTTGNNSLASIDTKLTSPLTVTGPLTDTQLRATPVPVTETPSSVFSTNNLTSGSGDVNITVSGYNTMTFQATGTWAGTVTFYGSTDGSTYNFLNAVNLQDATASPVISIFGTASDGMYQFNTSGLKIVRFQNTVATGTLSISNGLSTAQGSLNAIFGDIASISYTKSGIGEDIQALLSNPSKYNLGVAQSATDYVLSSGNSTTAQLAGGATFTGAIETVFNQQAASILLTSDKAGTLTIIQYIDLAGTRTISTLAYGISAGIPFSRSITVNGNYFRLTFANSAGAATTTLNINTAYGTLPPSTNLSNLPVSLDEIQGNLFFPVVKGTQATQNIPTQDIKDSGRVIKTYTATFTAATTEAMITLTPAADGTTGSTGTTFAVTAGKRLRLQAMTISTRNAGAAIQGCQVSLRMSASGSVTTSSTIVANIGTGTLSATSNNVNSNTVSIPDGLELSGTMQLGISQVGTATANNIVTLIGYEY